jgi:choline monooxygenase
LTSGFDFEPDLARARTPPARVYFDPAIWERERAQVFGRSWQLATRAELLAEPGAYVATTMGGEPVLVARGEDGTLRALSNVCRHRAGPVAQGEGQLTRFRCGYHGWTYGLDGRLLGTPEFEGVAGFDRAASGLPSFRVATWGPWVFVNQDAQAPDLVTWLGSISGETARWGLERLRLFRAHDYDMACNWKVYVDNYLEGYHIPVVHPALFRELDYQAYRVETARWHSRQHAPLRGGTGSVYDAGDPEVLYYWLFPNLMINVYPGNVQLNLVVPLGPERTRARFEWYVEDPSRPGLAEELAPALALGEQVQREDAAICEAVQRGLRSATYDRGRYSVRRENGVHHFHGLLDEYLR